MIRIHPHALGKLMTNAKSKKPDDLSAGALTYCEELAKQIVYGIRPQISSKYLEKGLICENDSIALYNDVSFTSLKKNTERKENDWLTGECDILTKSKVIDIKTSWSIASFPATKAAAHDPGYEWQGRAYMMLWDRPMFELAFCLVTTPPELIGFEDEEMHIVDHIDPALRVTAVQYERCVAKEELIKIKCDAAKKQIESFMHQIAIDHAA